MSGLQPVLVRIRCIVCTGRRSMARDRRHLAGSNTSPCLTSHPAGVRCERSLTCWRGRLCARVCERCVRAHGSGRAGEGGGSRPPGTPPPPCDSSRVSSRIFPVFQPLSLTPVTYIVIGFYIIYRV